MQVNVNLSDEDIKMLDRMMEEDAYLNRSAWVRRLIRQEWARRYSKPNPAISVADATTAARAIKGENA